MTSDDGVHFRYRSVMVGTLCHHQAGRCSVAIHFPLRSLLEAAGGPSRPGKWRADCAPHLLCRRPQR